MNQLATSVLVPIVVSAFVALGIEYFAKPTLEVRKRKVLLAFEIRHQAFHAMTQAYWKLTLLTGLSAEMPPGWRRSEVLEGAKAQLHVYEDLLASPMLRSLPVEIYKLFSRSYALGDAACLALKSAGREEQVARLLDGVPHLLDIMDEYFRTPSWRKRRKRNILRHATTALAAMDTSDIPLASGAAE